MVDDPERIKSLFLQASALPDSSKQAEFLARACGGNHVMRTQIEKLLRGSDGCGVISDSSSSHGRTHVSDQGDDSQLPVECELPADGEHPTAFQDSVAATAFQSFAVADGTVIGERYQLVSKVGEGGMGEVWIAKQLAPVKRTVALKLIKSGMDTKTVLQRFDQERQALALMNHPNIARVLDAGMTAGGRPFFVMELVEGIPLTKYCDEARLGIKERLELFTMICLAVQHAHQKGIIHRDLKPANILVTQVDGRPTPKVIDFGVAKATSGKLTDETLSTGFGSVVGTLEYMSPEQASNAGADIDTRSDIYSLGVILYELLTGVRPIDARQLLRGGLLELIRIIREEEPLKPSTRLSTDESLPSLAAARQTDPRRLMTELRGELDWVVMKCLEKQRNRRYESASSLARDIQRYLVDEPVEARPPSAGYRAGKFILRHKQSVIAASIILFALIAGIAGTTWGLFEAQRQEELARGEAREKENARKVESEQRLLAELAREDALNAFAAEKRARQQTEAALLDSQRKTARMTYEKGQTLCEQGKSDVGLLEMARSLELTPSGATDIEFTIRTSLNLWAGQVNTIHPRKDSTAWKGTGVIHHFATSPDGRSLAIAQSKGGIEICDLFSGNVINSLHQEPEPINTRDRRVVFSSDGRYVALADGDSKQALVWAASTGQPVGKPLVHDDYVSGVAFNPTGELLATASGRQIRLFDIERNQPLGEPLPLEMPAKGVEVSHDGTQLLVWTHNQILVFDVSSQRIIREFSSVDFTIDHACICPKDQYVLATGRQIEKSGAFQRRAQFWELNTGNPIGSRMDCSDQYLSPGWDYVSCFRPDGRVAVTAGYPLRLWAVPSGQPLGTTTKAGSNRLAFSRDGKSIVAFNAGTSANAIELLDVAPDLLPLETRQLPSIRSGVAFSTPDARTAVTLSQQGLTFTYQLFDLENTTEIGPPIVLEIPSIGGINFPGSPAFSPDGRFLATSVESDSCQMRNIVTGNEHGPKISMDSYIQTMKFSPDGKLLATGSVSGRIQLWNTSTGEPVGSPIIHTEPPQKLVFSPDNRHLFVISGYANQIVLEARMWDVATQQPLGPMLKLIGSLPTAVFSPDGRTFATGTYELSLWNAATCEKVWTAVTSSTCRRLAFSPDGLRLLVEQWEENAVQLFDVKTGSPLSVPLRHANSVTQATFSPNGRLILTCGNDATARLWDGVTGLPVGKPWQSAFYGWFSQDGHSLFLQNRDTISRWRIPEPIQGSSEQVRRSVEAATGFTTNDIGSAVLLMPSMELAPPGSETKLQVGPDPYEQVLDQLKQLGGPVGLFRRTP